MAIYISENGFIALTLSAIETSINREAAGIILGYKVRRKGRLTYFVENVVPYQIAKRTSSSVEVNSDKCRRIRRVFQSYLKYNIIGEFHTHPQGNIHLSSADKRFVRSSNYKLEIVVAIDINKKYQSWCLKNNILSGSIDKYFISIAGWKVEKQKVIKQNIRCPYAVGFSSF